VKAFLLALLLALLGAVIEAELKAWSPQLGRWLIRRAAAPLPQPHHDRYLEEWSRELDEVPDGPLTRLCVALRLVLGRASLARELGVPQTVVGLTGTLKRLCDIVLAGCGLVIAVPLLVVIATCIKVVDGGPVIFRQRRIGLNGKPFAMLRFRTMVVDTEPSPSPLVDADLGEILVDLQGPHVTRLGRFLRRYSLDELPEIFNILTGSMSLVGPRPRRKMEWDILGWEPVPVRPGLTGLWQLEGQPDEDQQRLDREYVKRWSIWLDIKIVFKTFVAVLANSGPPQCPLRREKERRFGD
jgi:lipopolysaccharide/colanic/teichoic acid biosynthesis glycosyltransferase